MRNDIAKQIFDCRSGKEGVAKILNGVSLSSGSLGGETSVFAVASKWTVENPLYEALNHVKVSRMFYTTQDIDAEGASANAWSKESEEAKALQALTLTPQPILTSIFYKQLDVAQEDMDDLNDSGEYAEFLEWATWELRRHTEDLVISSLLGNSEIYTGTVTYPFLKDKVSSVFTTVTTKSQSGDTDFAYITVQNVADMVATVKTERKWLVINPDDLKTLVEEMAIMNPAADQFSLAGRVGVDYVYSTTLAMRGKVICLDPDEMWLREKNTIEVAYPLYHYNKTNMLYEINCGIRPHAPLCSAMLLGSTMN